MLHPSDILRVVDAASNRLVEALRTLEDVVRFGENNVYLTSRLKALRHEFEQIVDRRFPKSERLLARDTLGDVGTTVTTVGEFERGDLSAVLAANFSRAQQAIRSLEEQFKIVNSEDAQQLEQLRYATYALEKCVMVHGRSQDALAYAVVYALVDAGYDEASFRHRIQRLVSAGVDAIQLREKRLPDRQLLQRCRAMVELTRSSAVLTFVNDRPDLAALARTHGVHLGQDDLSIQDARRILHTDQWIGYSTHSLEQARRAVLEGADYLGIGPVFSSKTKDFDAPIGIATLREVARDIELPTFAIGGIHLDNIDEIAKAGIRRVAVASLLAADDDAPGHLDEARDNGPSCPLSDTVRALRYALQSDANCQMKEA